MQVQKVVLVGVDHDKNKMDVESCLDELEELCITDGLEVVGRIIQRREHIHNAHYVGKGKLDEIFAMVTAFEADGVICDDELTGSQMKNMKKVLKCDVIDRTMLILNIFAKRAKSAEGKLQVELASLRYRLSHLTGFGKEMSRIGGGSSTYTRGAGETKLELDRRVIRFEIDKLNREIKEIQAQRGVSRAKRLRNKIPVVSMAGYTNAGKSTLLNYFTSAGVLAEDKLFATLDTTTRKIELPGGTEILFTDTVGFIQKLPHILVSAFRATLEEAFYADIIVHVTDASNKERQTHMNVVYETLKELGCGEKPVITVFNKIDKDVEYPLPEDKICEAAISLSAATGENCDALLREIESLIKRLKKEITVLIPYSEGKLVNLIHGNCEVVSETHEDEGTRLVIFAAEELENKLEKYIIS